MERIGVAASKMAKGNLFLYNIYVIVICVVFSLLIFILAGITVALALLMISLIVQGIGVNKYFPLELNSAFVVCMMALTIVMAIFNLFAILRNLKLTKPKIDPFNPSKK